MTARVLGAFTILLALPAAAGSHQLDEYLQATRVVLGPDRVALEIALTPGVAVAGAIIALMDTDGNRLISETEARAYTLQIVTDLDVTIDGARRDLAVSRFAFPPVPEMMDGMGTIRLEVTLAAAAGAPGAHYLTYRNNHQPALAGATAGTPATAAYLVNALVPESSDIEITGQQRDELQRSFRVDYTIAPARARWSWLTIAALGFTTLVGYRRRERATRASSCGQFR